MCLYMYMYMSIIEIRESREGSIGRCWDGSIPNRARTTTTTCRPIDFLPNKSLPVQIHSPQMKLVVQRGEQVFLPCRVLNLGKHFSSTLSLLSFFIHYSHYLCFHVLYNISSTYINTAL